MPHKSVFKPALDYLRPGYNFYLDDCKDQIVEQMKASLVAKKEFFDQAFEDADSDGKFYFVDYSILDYRPHVFQKRIKLMLEMKDLKTCEDVTKRKFARLQYVRNVKGLLKQALWSRTDLQELQCIGD